MTNLSLPFGENRPPVPPCDFLSDPYPGVPPLPPLRETFESGDIGERPRACAGDRVSFRIDARDTEPYRARRSRVSVWHVSRHRINTCRANSTRHRSRSATATTRRCSRAKRRRVFALLVRARHSSSPALSNRVVVMYVAIRRKSSHSNALRVPDRCTACGVGGAEEEAGPGGALSPKKSLRFFSLDSRSWVFWEGDREGDPGGTGRNVEVVVLWSKSLPAAVKSKEESSSPISLDTRRSDASASCLTTERHRRARSALRGVWPSSLPELSEEGGEQNAASAAAAAKAFALFVDSVSVSTAPGESGQVFVVGSGPSLHIKLEDVSPLCIQAEKTASSSIARFSFAARALGAMGPADAGPGPFDTEKGAPAVPNPEPDSVVAPFDSKKSSRSSAVASAAHAESHACHTSAMASATPTAFSSISLSVTHPDSLLSLVRVSATACRASDKRARACLIASSALSPPRLAVSLFF
mmetsp:Transcript_1549/g.5837  ORF Transcript_1549/g.5837 Transcript_1549/m.5837 type:complete len:470 (+) Transcript_1549:157-1566(+)